MQSREGTGWPGTLANTGPCSVHKRERVSEALIVCAKIPHFAFCSAFLTERGRGHSLLCDPYSNMWLIFFFILLLRGLESVDENQISPRGSIRHGGLEGTVRSSGPTPPLHKWESWGLERGSDVAKITKQVREELGQELEAPHSWAIEPSRAPSSSWEETCVTWLSCPWGHC